MNLRDFFNYMKTYDARNLKILLAALAVLAVLVNVFFRVEKIRASQVKQHNEQIEVLQKANAIQAEYERNKDALDSGNLKRALEKSNVEVYQARLLQMLEAQHIKIQNVTALKPVQKDKQAPNGIEYDATWVGTWKNVMSALKAIESEPVAVNFSSIRLEATEDKEVVRAGVKYKIYIVD